MSEKFKLKKGTYNSQIRGLGPPQENKVVDPHLLKPEARFLTKNEEKRWVPAEQQKQELVDEFQHWRRMRERREKVWEEQRRQRENYLESLLGISLQVDPKTDIEEEPKCCSSGSHPKET